MTRPSRFLLGLLAAWPLAGAAQGLLGGIPPSDEFLPPDPANT